MSTTELILEKVSALPPEKQQEVLQYVESISASGRSPEKTGKSHAWIDTCLKANLQGPADLSENLDDYLYGDKKNAW